LVVIVILVKTFVAGGTSFILGHTFLGTVMVGIALSQVGEFSFILARLGLQLNIISSFYFQLFIAVSVTTMSLSPFLIPLSKRVALLFLKLPLPKQLVEGIFPLPQIDIPDFENHLVFIGKDPRALNLTRMARYLDLPYISIVFDPSIVRERQKKGENIIYGDAVNDPILLKAHVDRAQIVVISVGSLITSMAIIERVKALNRNAYIIVRSKNIEDIEELYKLGADQVIPEEFETAIELFERVLKKLLIPAKRINSTVAKIRNDHYGIFRDKVKRIDHSILDELPNINISALKIDDESFMIGKSLDELRFRSTYGVTVIAILRGSELIEHPDSKVNFKKEDVVYIMGRPDQVKMAIEALTG
jgi:monovalent cation:H+ antiporter-2, CPA2 family